jgi:DNA-binding transcriptional ArsR family regulator
MRTNADFKIAREIIGVIRAERQGRSDRLKNEDQDFAYLHWLFTDEPFINEMCLMVLVAVRHQVEGGLISFAARANVGPEVTREQHEKYLANQHYHMVVDKLDTTFAALSDPTLRAMIDRLSHWPASVHRLTEPFALSQQMISKHIAHLVRARMVIKTKRGRESVCTLRPKAIKPVSNWAVSYRRFWQDSFDKLDVVVDQMKKADVRDDKKHG